MSTFDPTPEGFEKAAHELAILSALLLPGNLMQVKDAIDHLRAAAGLAREVAELRKKAAFVEEQCESQIIRARSAEARLAAQDAELAELRKPWTDAQCAEFLSVAFRHVRIIGTIVCDELRQGVTAAIAQQRPSP